MAIYVYTEIEPPFEREQEYNYTGSDQVLTIPRNGKYFLETKGAGSNSGAGGLATAYFNLREGDKLAVMVGQKGGANAVTYGFGGSSNYSSGGGGAGLTGFFTGETTITATDSARALIIGGGAGGTIKAGDGGAGGGTTGANGYGSSYGTAGGGGTQTGRGSGGNTGASQFNGGNGTGTYGAGGGGGWRGGNGSAGDGSGADDKGAGGGSGYISSAGTDGTNTQGGGSAKSTDGRAKITFIEDWTPPVPPTPVTGLGHIPNRQEFLDLKSIMDGLSLTTGNDYKVKLHMPFAGYRNSPDASIYNQGGYGRYWSSSPYGSAYPKKARYLNLYSSNVNADENTYRSFGASVRLFLDEYVEPDNTRTVEQGTLGGAGIFHNPTLGLISVTNGTDKSITMYDKNVGATTVYNDGDTLTEANMGRMFQRGNYYGFPSTGTISKTSSTAVDTTGYGGDNPYSSDTWITVSDLSDPSNDNLRTDSKEGYFVIE